MDDDGRRRVAIEGVRPEINAGRFPIKRVVGDSVTIEADVFCDGHDAISGVLRYRREREDEWHETPLVPLVNDRWRASFVVTELGRYLYTLEAWVDHWKSWRRDIAKKVEAGQDVAVDLLSGGELVEAAASRAVGAERDFLMNAAGGLRGASGEGMPVRIALAESDRLARAMERYPNRALSTRYPRELGIVVERERAAYGAWYEFFPRSVSPSENIHGTFRTAVARLDYAAAMHFDVIYLPPIHPIGTAYRKGKNNSMEVEPDDPGSPWAIGAAAGGHTAIHPDLGTLDDFRAFERHARSLGLELALDFAINCSPDHPWVREHPQWFWQRPDGTIQYAENPPKKYQDIYPINYESEDWRALWEELRQVLRFWAREGVRIFRVDNPHTKAFPFWEWVIGAIKEEYPDAFFLAEAFTRPKVMYRLAKCGFSQSYTYFPWRNTKAELTEYFTHLTHDEVREYFRGSQWTNTQDILTEYVQHGRRAGSLVRFILAATLSPNYGIYGPAFELLAHTPRPGAEEYIDSEKYQIVHWDTDRLESLAPFITRVNRIRRENLALQRDAHLTFHPTDNEQLIAYSKRTDDDANVILVVVNLDPHHTHSGWVELPLAEWGFDPEQSYQAHDLLTDARYLWQGGHNYVMLDPQSSPAHLFRLRRRVRTERDFDYYL